MKRVKDANLRRKRRKQHIRKRISGTPARPRMTVYKSNKHLYVQVIDDIAGVTVAAVSDLEADLKGGRPTVENASKIGEAIGSKLKKQKIETVVFDRNGYPYHGVVKAIAEGTRKAGIKL